MSILIYPIIIQSQSIVNFLTPHYMNKMQLIKVIVHYKIDEIANINSWGKLE